MPRLRLLPLIGLLLVATAGVLLMAPAARAAAPDDDLDDHDPSTAGWSLCNI